MDLPLIGTVDFTPSGLFLVFAVLVAVVYVASQIATARREHVRARDAEASAPAGETAAGDDSEGPGPN